MRPGRPYRPCSHDATAALRTEARQDRESDARRRALLKAREMVPRQIRGMIYTEASHQSSWPGFFDRLTGTSPLQRKCLRRHRGVLVCVSLKAHAGAFPFRRRLRPNHAERCARCDHLCLHHCSTSNALVSRVSEQEMASRRRSSLVKDSDSVSPLIGHPAQTCWALKHEMRVASNQRDGAQLHHVTVDGLAEWIAWWDAQEASA
jgi:hypothetical protein